MTPQNCSSFVTTMLVWSLSIVPLTFVFSQNQKVVDSLLTVLPGRSGADKYAVYHWLTAEYADWDNEKAFEYARQAEKVAYEVGDDKLIIKSQRIKGQILFRLGRPQDVISVLTPIMSDSIIRKGSPEYLAILNLMGASHVVMSQYDRGLDLYFQTYESAKRRGDKEYLAISLDNIGVTYYKLKDYRKALSYMLHSLTVRKHLNNATYLPWMNISLCYAHLGDIASARKYLRESIRTCGAKCSSQAMVHIEYASGLINYQSGQLNEAARDFQQSLQLSRQVEDSRLVLDNIYLLAKIYIGSNKLTEARQLLTEGEEIIQRGIPFNLEMIKVYRELSELYIIMKDYHKASFYQSRYIALKDSIYDESMTTALMAVESQYLEKENEAKLASQDELIILKERMINRQITLNIVSGFLILISGILLFSLFIGFLKKKRFNRILAERINERTAELEQNQAALFTALEQQRNETKRLYYMIQQSSKTLEGLCHAATIDSKNLNMHGYINMVRSCSIKLLRDVEAAVAMDERYRLDDDGKKAWPAKR